MSLIPIHPHDVAWRINNIESTNNMINRLWRGALSDLEFLIRFHSTEPAFLTTGSLLAIFL